MIGSLIITVTALWAQPEMDLFSRGPKLTAQDRAALNAAKEWIDSGPVGGTDGSVTYMYGERTPTLICSVLHICSLDLQQGEEITGLQLGDTIRWKVDIGHSGLGLSKRLSVVFKPSDAGLKTNVLIFTTRRKYALNLLSTREYFTPTVRFDYPDSVQKKVLEYQAQAAAETPESKKNEQRLEPLGVLLEDIDDDYLIEGDTPWKPTRVYSTHRQTVIRFPEGTQYRGIPVLTITHYKGGGKGGLVNYRQVMKGDVPHFVVDALFERAQLVVGTGRHRQRIVVKHKAKTPSKQGQGATMEALVWVMVSGLCGLMPTSDAFGNQVELNEPQEQSLLEAAAAQLLALYPPARTHFRLVHSPGRFGRNLLQRLRESGYAITEFIEPERRCAIVARRDHRLARLVKCRTARTSPGAVSNVTPLNFVIDSLDEGEYRLTLVVDGRPMTRAFRLEETSIEAVGHWVVLEGAK